VDVGVGLDVYVELYVCLRVCVCVRASLCDLTKEPQITAIFPPILILMLITKITGELVPSFLFSVVFESNSTLLILILILKIT